MEPGGNSRTRVRSVSRSSLTRAGIAAAAGVGLGLVAASVPELTQLVPLAIEWLPQSLQILLAAALGYVAFTDPPEILVDAIQAVSRGNSFVSADAERLLAVAAPSMPVPLTEKQRRLLALYVDGMTLRAAAAVIGITQGTAHGYLRLIRKKFRAAGIPATTKIELGLALHGRADRL